MLDRRSQLGGFSCVVFENSFPLCIHTLKHVCFFSLPCRVRFALAKLFAIEIRVGQWIDRIQNDTVNFSFCFMLKNHFLASNWESLELPSTFSFLIESEKRIFVELIQMKLSCAIFFSCSPLSPSCYGKRVSEATVSLMDHRTTEQFWICKSLCSLHNLQS